MKKLKREQNEETMGEKTRIREGEKTRTREGKRWQKLGKGKDKNKGREKKRIREGKRGRLFPLSLLHESTHSLTLVKHVN